MKDKHERTKARLCAGMVAGAASLLAVWLAPAASADNLHRNGFYYPRYIQMQPMFAAHIDMVGRTGMDTSQPAARVTMSNGCVMDWYFLDNAGQGWIGSDFALSERAEVASGASEYCRPSARISVLMHGDTAIMEATDSAGGGTWFFPA